MTVMTLFVIRSKMVLYFYINVLIYMLLYLYFLTFTIMLLYYVGSDHKVKRSHKKKLATAAPPISSMLQCVMIYYYFI